MLLSHLYNKMLHLYPKHRLPYDCDKILLQVKKLCFTDSKGIYHRLNTHNRL
jgi:hypothetical protein